MAGTSSAKLSTITSADRIVVLKDGIVEQTGYGTYFWITALVGIPAVLLFFWLLPRVEMGDDDAPAVAIDRTSS